MAAGTYYPSVEYCGTGDNRYKSFQLKNSVAVYGGFDPSNGDVGWEDRDWEANAVTLSGDIGNPGDNNDNSYHVFCHPEGLNLDNSAVLDGFSITAGNADDASNFYNLGGGMYNNGSSPTLSNVTFSGNTTDGGGGGMANEYAAPMLNAVTFSGNTAANNPHFTSCYGGGLWNGAASPTLTNVTFSENTADVGGGMYNNGSSPNLVYVNFVDNTSLASAGGMFNIGSSPVLTNVNFYGNMAGGNGGGMMNSDSSSPELTNVIFSNNAAAVGGGGMYNGNTSSPTLTNVTFSNNSADTWGGGIRNSNASPMLVNVTFSINTAFYGGGAMLSSDSSSSMLTDCILWGDLPDEIINADTSNSIVSYSDIQGGYSGEANIDIDPLLGPLQDNGGFVLTHALVSGSPAIDAGNPDPATCPSTDAHGEPRPIDGDGDGNAVCDMGSYEFSISPTLITITGPETGLAGENQEFSALVEPISTTLPLTYFWQASGQTPITNTGGLTDTVSFTWYLTGTHFITVTASNPAGAVSDTHMITITDQPIEGLIASNNSPTVLGEDTTFTATLTSGTNVIYSWDFGDESDGIGQIVTHTYSSVGEYTATVTATNSVGSLTETTLVNITDPVYPSYLPLVIKSSSKVLTPTHPSAPLGEGEWMGLVIVGIVGMWKRRG